jgi:Asp-tRNA(Asn)/Glu-tRNA(Gln) amidotransferase B subunit
MTALHNASHLKSKLIKGKANPQRVNELLKAKLGL